MNEEPAIRIGVSGSGRTARRIVLAAESAGIAVSRVLTRRSIDGADEFPRPELLTRSLGELLTGVDAVLECSGDPMHATDVADAALSAGLPVITLNAAFHVLCGSYFRERGLLTEAEGDLPGALAVMREAAIRHGYRPLVFGAMTHFDHLPTVKDMEYWAERRGVSVPVATASMDGTLLQLRQALVANWAGADIAAAGMLGPAVDDLLVGAESLAEQARTLGRPVGDYLVTQAREDGVFLVAEHDEEHPPQPDGYAVTEGRYFTIVQDEVEAGPATLQTVRAAVRERRVLLDNSARPRISVAAVAKRRLAPGTRIAHGIGSFHVRGMAVRIGETPGHLPIGLVADALVTRTVETGAMLTFDDVEVPDSLALHAWRDTERAALSAAG